MSKPVIIKASRKNDNDITTPLNGEHQANELIANTKDGRARIVDPPRYEEVGISGFPSMVNTP